MSLGYAARPRQELINGFSIAAERHNFKRLQRPMCGPPERLPDLLFLFEPGIVLGRSIDHVPDFVGNVDILGGAFVEIGLPGQCGILRHIAGLKAGFEIAPLAQIVAAIAKVRLL